MRTWGNPSFSVGADPCVRPASGAHMGAAQKVRFPHTPSCPNINREEFSRTKMKVIIRPSCAKE